MEILTTLLIIVLVLAFLASKFFRANNPKVAPEVKRPAKRLYDYSAKDHVMTQSEESFFKLLNDTVGDKYYVFPQIHLSSILNHKIKGQNWKAAFSHINGKSVDYVLCDKATLKTVYAIELDDSTHEKKGRMDRDTEVERMFRLSGISIKRFTTEQSRDVILVKTRLGVLC